MILEFSLAIFYVLLLGFFIYKSRFFHLDGFKKTTPVYVFFLKVITGITLTFIYTYYYTERHEADIFKYFDDSAHIFNALFVNPIHYIQLVFGINPDAEYLNIYTQHTSFWAVQTDEYWQFTNTSNHNYFNSHRLITRFNALLRLFSFGFFSVHTVFMCFIALIGQTYLYKAISKFLPQKKQLLLFAVYLLPSVLLWSSGVLKEGFIFLGMGIFFYFFLKITHQKATFRDFILILLSLALMITVKYYLVAAIVPAAVAYYLTVVFKNKSPIVIHGAVYVLITTIVFSVAAIFSSIPSPLKILADKQTELIKEGSGGYYFIRNNNAVEEYVYFPPETEIVKIITDSARNVFKLKPGITAYKYENGHITGEQIFIDDSADANIYYWEIFANPKSGSYVEIKKLEPHIISMLTALPQGLFNVLFRPHIFEIKSFIMAPAALENLLLLLFLIICIFYGTIKKDNLNLLLMLMAMVLILYSIIGITTPVLGSIVRYKTPFLPFLIIAMIMILDIQKIQKIIK